eukprot:358847-Pleurochrysis_carterae.AAC.1
MCPCRLGKFEVHTHILRDGIPNVAPDQGQRNAVRARRNQVTSEILCDSEVHMAAKEDVKGKVHDLRHELNLVAGVLATSQLAAE